MAHFNLREFAKAIESFEEAYRLKPDPVFLYNLAQSHRLLDQHERALYFYAYLRTSPDAPNRSEVEGRIATLEKVVATQKEAAKPPDTALEPKEPASKTPVAAPTPTATETTIVRAGPAPGQKKPVYKQWWLWAIVGVAAVGVGVGLGVGLSQQGAPSYPALRFY